MINNILRFCVIIAVMLSVVACEGSYAVSDELLRAETAMARGDVPSAQRIADDIFGQGVETLAVNDLGRLSMVYMSLADSVDQGGNVSKATNCYRQAFVCHSDSATEFYTNLPPEQMPYVMVLSTIVGKMENVFDPTAVCDHDSLMISLEQDTVSFVNR